MSRLFAALDERTNAAADKASLREWRSDLLGLLEETTERGVAAEAGS